MKYKAVLFDADNTLIDFPECEKQALQFLFATLDIKYKSEYHPIFHLLDRQLWDNSDNAKYRKRDIPTYRFKLFFNEIGIKFHDYHKANELFKQGLTKSTALYEESHEIVKYLFDKGYKLCHNYKWFNRVTKTKNSKYKNRSILYRNCYI